MEVYIVHNCLNGRTLTCNNFETAEKVAETMINDVVSDTSLLGVKYNPTTRNNMVWSFANGIVAVYIERVYLGRFHADVLQLDKKMDVLLEQTSGCCYTEVLDFVKKIDELLNMKIIVANKQ